MAGTDSRFDATAFREAILFAMRMGTPDDDALAATFQWDTTATFDVSDSSGNPFDFGAAPVTEQTFSDVQVPVAVEMGTKAGDSQSTHFGEMDMPHITITVLDEQFAELTQNGVFANKVLFGDATYKIQYVEPAIGLFDVTVHQIHAQAIDET